MDPQIARPWIPLAQAALQASIDGDMETAGRHIHEIADQYGSKVIPAVLLSFVDTTCMRAFGRFTAQGAVGVAWFNEHSRDLQSADEVPPSIRWAGQFAAARFADDADTARALVDSVQTDEEWTANVAAVLHICGTTIRKFGRPGEHPQVIA